MKNIIIYTILALTIVSCADYKYPKNEKISTKNGALIDSLASYVIDTVELAGAKHAFVWNKDRLAELNSFYSLTNEPALFNYYLGRDVYRLVLVEKGKEPLILSINRTDENSWIVSKRIKESALTNLSDVEVMPDSILVSHFDLYSRALNQEELERFDSIWESLDFLRLTSDEAVGQKYGSYCFLEAHEKDKYWYVYRSLDDTSLEGVTTYIRSLTGF